MTRLVIALAIGSLLACSGKSKTTKPVTAGSGDPTLVKKVIVGWGFQSAGEMTDVFLATTDETGKQVSHPLGRYKGKCEKITPAKEMNAITGAACTTTGGGTELHAIASNSEIIVMQMGTTPGTTPDPMSAQEVTRVTVPLGSAIEAAP
ncbi:MAG TPA: hypothetical protein VFQ53_19870 [Kofleriaceae bacterium]|nr:hypothetical protein [Kofleriaceae bacterium]